MNKCIHICTPIKSALTTSISSQRDGGMIVIRFVTLKSFEDFKACWSVALYICMFVSMFYVTFLQLEFSFFYITVSLVRVEHDRILTNSVPFLHLTMTILATAFTNMW